MDTAAAPVSAQPEEIGSFGRLIRVIVNPRPTFESIVRRPSFVLPIVIGMIFFALIVTIFTQRGGWPSFFEKQDAKNSRVQQLPPEKQQELLNQQIKVAAPFGYVEAVILPILSAVIVAAIFFGLFNLTGSSKFGFAVALGIVAFAWTPWIIHGILGTVIVSLKDPTTIDLENLVASNPAAFLSDDAPKWLSALLGSIDLFAIWTMILLAIGFSATNPKKLSFAKSFSFVFAAWLFFVLVKVGMTSLFS